MCVHECEHVDMGLWGGGGEEGGWGRLCVCLCFCVYYV